MKYLPVILILFLNGLSVFAGHMIAKQMPFFYQLSSNEIFDVYQDREGYIWIGTTNGLERYDGYVLQSFRSDDKSPHLLTHNSIVSLSDNDLYVWIGTRRGVNLFDKKTGRILPFPGKELQNKEIGCIMTDRNNFTWIATPGKIYKCDRKAFVVKEYSVAGPDGISSIHFVYEDRSGNIWALTWGSGLFKYTAESDSFVGYPRIGEKNTPFTMMQDKEGRYWIGTWGDGLWRFFPDREGEECYKKQPVINSKDGTEEPVFFSMVEDDVYGYLWMLSYNELYALKPNGEDVPEKADIRDLVDTDKMYTKILKDRNGNLWLGSYDMAYTVFFDRSKIKNYPLSQLKEHLRRDANVVHLCLDEDSIMWINQDRYGLFLYDLSRNRMVDPGVNPGLPEVSVIIKSRFGEGVWAADRYVPRLMRLRKEGMHIKVEETSDLTGLTGSSGPITRLAEDRHGNLWILAANRLLVKPLNGSGFIISDENFRKITGLTVDGEGEIRAVSSDRHVYRMRYFDNRITKESDTRIPVLSEQEEIKNVCVDKEGCIWAISSFGKIYKSDKSHRQFNNMPLEKEIENGSVLELIPDRDNIRIITNKKVISYHIYRDIWTDYSTFDGNIVVNVFRNKAVSPDGEGGIYVGGHGGFIHIPCEENILPNKKNGFPAVTDVKVDDKSLFFSNGFSGSKREQMIDNIYLTPTDGNLEILLSALDYSLNRKNRFAYKLEGVDKDWVYVEDKHAVFYNQVNKGVHRFLIKTEYEPGKWSAEKVVLTIEKYPALYETWYARLFYVVCVGLGVYFLLRIYLRRMKIRNDIKFREELNRTKLDYFTNISHELLTPLTLIRSSVDYMEMKAPDLHNRLAVLRSNADRLKRLIQQVLDIRKMDMNTMRLSVRWGNIKDFITAICENDFLLLAQKKNIVLQADVKPDELWGYLDFDKTDKIIYNLLSNAIKYTPENKSIKVTADIRYREKHRSVRIKVEDTGIGMPEKELTRIFTRFYIGGTNKDVESNGIGLSLTKNLVNLHHGTISVESIPGKGSCFTVELPIDKESYTSGEIAGELIETDPEYVLPDDTDRFTVLFADDDTELLSLMRDIFQDRYHVLLATGGKEAWEMLNRSGADAVVCDVMMPDMNGRELCRRIKTDLRFNHMPVIMLTAGNDINDRVAGYESGADGYITKPFDAKVLIARINSLVKSYKTRQQDFQKEQNTYLESTSLQSADKQFLQSVIECIEQHLKESAFDLDRLSSHLNMSKSTLHRKIKSLTGLTPLDFVRNIKMKRACMLLITGDRTISEVAYAVGFSNPKYFTKCFKEEFGIIPSEYQQNKPVNIKV